MPSSALRSSSRDSSSRRAATYHDDRNTGRKREGREKSCYNGTSYPTTVPTTGPTATTNTKQQRQQQQLLAQQLAHPPLSPTAIIIHTKYVQHGHTSRSVPPALTAQNNRSMIKESYGHCLCRILDVVGYRKNGVVPTQQLQQQTNNQPTPFLSLIHI